MELDFSDVTQDYDLILKYINDTSRPIDLGMLLNVFTLSLSSSSQFRSSLCLIRELRVKRIPKVSDGLHWRELCAALIDNLVWSPTTVVLSRELLTDLLANTIISEDIFLSACVHPHPRVACEMDWCVSKLLKRHKINIREGFEKVKKDCEVYIKQDCKEDRGTPKSEEKKAAIKEILHFPKDVNLWLKTIDEASKTEIGKGDNQNCEITEILEDLRSDNANTKNRGLKSLKCLSKDLRKHCSIADDLLEVLHPLIKNPDYRKESCLALAHLIEVNCLKSVADSTLHLLFQAVCSSTSKRSACPPFLTLTVIVRHMKPIRMIPFVQFNLKRAKSGTPTKKRMLCLLEQILTEWPRKNLIKMSATLFELLRAGFNGDPNESFHFKKIYWCFEAKFHLQAVALFMKLDVRCQAKPFDTPKITSSVCVTPAMYGGGLMMDPNQSMVGHMALLQGQPINGQIPLQEPEDINKPVDLPVEDLESYQGSFTDLQVIKSSRISRVLRATVGLQQVVVRIVKNEERERTNREIDAANKLKAFQHLTVPLLFAAHLSAKSILVLEYFPDNLEAIVRQSKMQSSELDEVVHRLIQGVAVLHRLNIIHSDLTPERVFVSQHEGDVLVRIGNFERSTEIDGQSLYEPTPQWAPEVSERSGRLTKLDDIFTLGKLILFIWTGLKPSHGSTALEPKEGDFCRVKKLVKIAGSTNFSSIGLDGKKVAVLEAALAHPSWRRQAEDLAFMPAFWKEGSLCYFFERLHDLIKTKGSQVLNSNDSKDDYLQWKENAPTNLLNEMVEFIESKRDKQKSNVEKVKSPYEDSKKDFVRFCRNLSVHRKTIMAANYMETDILMEKFLWKNFEHQIKHIIKHCSGNLGNDFKRVFSSRLITPWTL